MKDITMKKSVLLEKLRENQKAHKAIFDEAVDGYKKQALALLEQHLRRIRDGKMIEVSVHLPVPENHTRDYDRVIAMMELDIAETVALSEGDFAQYVLDDWKWKRQFLESNKAYSLTAARMSEAYDR